MTESVSSHNSGPSFAILGTGAVGGFYGGLLARAGYEVHFLARTDFDHISTKGLQIESPLGDFLIRPKVYSSADAMPQVDCVIVAWKTTANLSLPALLTHFKPSKPIVIALQNGLNIESTSASVVGQEFVYGGCCFLCCNRVSPGRIKHLDYGRIAIGAYAESAGSFPAKLMAIVDALRQSGIDIQLSDSLAEIRWKKLVWNIPFNGLSVVLNADTAEIMNDPHACKLAEELMEEVAESAKSCGVSVGRDHIDKMLSDTRVMVPYASSMLLDFQHGRPLEVEAIFGNPLRAAIAAGFHPRRIEMLYRQLKFIDSRGKQSPDIRSTNI